MRSRKPKVVKPPRLRAKATWAKARKSYGKETHNKPVRDAVPTVQLENEDAKRRLNVIKSVISELLYTK